VWVAEILCGWRAKIFLRWTHTHTQQTHRHTDTHTDRQLKLLRDTGYKVDLVLRLLRDTGHKVDRILCGWQGFCVGGGQNFFCDGHTHRERERDRQLKLLRDTGHKVDPVLIYPSEQGSSE
jgi:3',5'-cyclic AMP phosphodiesterase CpdA